jgi:RNA polymerase sigma-70 factor (ECF subfamily)
MHLDDAAAVARAAGGDEDAFRVLVERHSRSVFRLAYRMTGSPTDAEDVVQETFVRAYRQLARFEARSNFRHGCTASGSTARSTICAAVTRG